MSQYYNSQRTRGLYDPKKNSAKGEQAFKLKGKGEKGKEKGTLPE